VPENARITIEPIWRSEKKKTDELEARLIQNNAFLGELGDLEVRGWYFLKNNFSATSGPF
jgi:hypothetical protein